MERTAEQRAKIKEILPNIFAVGIPKDTVIAEMYDKESLPLALMCYVKDPKEIFNPGIPILTYPIPPGSYTFLFCSNDVTEEQAAGVVHKPMLLDDQLEVWNDYTSVMDMGFDTAIESFHSLLRSHNLTGNYAIIQKLKPWEKKNG